MDGRENLPPNSSPAEKPPTPDVKSCGAAPIVAADPGLKRQANESRHGARHQPLVSITFAVAAGIILDRYRRYYSFYLGGDTLLEAGHIAWWFLAAWLLLIWWLLWHAGRDRLAVWIILAAAASVAAAWHDLRWSRFHESEIGRYAPFAAQPACVEAVARETPRRVSAPEATPLRAVPSGERSRMVVHVTAVRDGTHWRPASGICQVTVNGHLLGVRPGDRLRIFGQLVRPAPPLNPGEFDFAAHARADRHLVRLRSSAPDCIQVLERESYPIPMRMLDSARNGCKRLIHEFIESDRAELARAILLGDRSGLQYEQTEPYLVTGTIHVLVVSGMNVAILAAGLLGMVRLGWIARRVGLAVIIATVVAYALLAELQPPVLRAAVLGVLLCVAAWIGRRGVAFNSLAAAALVVLVINPADLFRPGPQLSFLAVAVLIWVGKHSFAFRQSTHGPLERLIGTARYWYEQLWVWVGRPVVWIVATSLAVWLATLPLVLMDFHIGSPVSVLISPAVWLLVLVAMWSGFAMLVVGWLAPSLGSLFGLACGTSLGGLEHVVKWAESLPYGHFWSPGPAWWWVLVFYLALLVAMIPNRVLMPPHWYLAALSAWVLVGLATPLVRSVSRDGLECSFLAVGHGACILLESPTGETLLYDAGALGSPEIATQSIASYLWHRGIMRIDGLVVSHADIDHYNAVPGLLERFRVGAVFVSPVTFDGIGEAATGGGPQVLRNAIRDAGVPIREIWAGDTLHLAGGVSALVLHPSRTGVIGSDNANSVTLAVEYRGRRLLLTGDLESPGLDDVMAELPYDCDVLLAPHHGSRHSDPPGLAAWSRPELVVISGAGGGEVEPVVATYLRTGAVVLETHRQGTVRVSLGPEPVRFSTWRNVRGELPWLP
jgi:competence protein ComEC